MTRLEELERRYREHHARSRPPDFVFDAIDRPPLFAKLVGGPGKRVLDLGCRSGALTRAYLDGNDIVGVDIDRDALEDAAKLGISTLWSDVEGRLPFVDASFDVVVAGELLEHLRDPRSVVDETLRVLRPGGRFVGSVPNAYRVKNRLRFLLGHPPEPDPTHLHMFRPDELRAMLSEFRDVELRFIAGRLVPLHARLFANVIVFTGRKPASP